MNENVLPAAIDQDEEEVTLLSGTDIKHWEVVQRVIQALREGARNTKEACKKAGVDRDLYYRALRNPYVQNQRAQQIMATLATTQELVERNWFDVMANMVSVAKGDSREAVPAARFVWEVYGKVQEAVGAEDDQLSSIGEDFLKTFAGKGKGRYKVTKKGKEIQEEVEIEFPDGKAGKD